MRQYVLRAGQKEAKGPAGVSMSAILTAFALEGYLNDIGPELIWFGNGWAGRPWPNSIRYASN